MWRWDGRGAPRQGGVLGGRPAGACSANWTHPRVSTRRLSANGWWKHPSAGSSGSWAFANLGCAACTLSRATDWRLNSYAHSPGHNQQPPLAGGWTVRTRVPLHICTSIRARKGRARRICATPTSARPPCMRPRRGPAWKPPWAPGAGGCTAGARRACMPIRIAFWSVRAASTALTTPRCLWPLASSRKTTPR